MLRKFLGVGEVDGVEEDECMELQGEEVDEEVRVCMELMESFGEVESVDGIWVGDGWERDSLGKERRGREYCDGRVGEIVLMGVMTGR